MPIYDRDRELDMIFGRNFGDDGSGSTSEGGTGRGISSIAPPGATFDPKMLGGMLGPYLGYLNGGMGDWFNAGSDMDSWLGNYYGGTDPNRQYKNVAGDLDYYGDNARNFGQGPFWDTMNSNLDYLNEYGLPGTQGLQGDLDYWRGTGSSLLGGQGKGYGVSDLLSQIFTEGLPNQRGVEDMFDPQRDLGEKYQGRAGSVLDDLSGRYGRGGAPLRQDLIDVGGGLLKNPLRSKAPRVAREDYSAYNRPSTSMNQAGSYANRLANVPGVGAPRIQGPVEQGLYGQLGKGVNQVATPKIQGSAEGRLEEQLGSGGLTKEYVDAMKELVLEPELDETKEDFNKQGGGVAAMDSGLSKELQRRTTRDFSNKLLTTGYEGYGKALDRSLDLGKDQYAQGYGNTGLYNKLLDQGAGFGQQQFDQGGFNADLQSKNLYNAGNLLYGLGGLESGQALDWAKLGQTGELANQSAFQRANESDIDAQLKSYELGGNWQESLYNQGLGLAKQYADLGQTGIENAFSAFDLPAKDVYPYAELGGKLGTEMGDLGIRGYDTLSNRGLENLRTIQDLKTQPWELQQLYGGKNVDRRGALLNSTINGGNDFYGNQSRRGLGYAGLGSDLMGRYVGGEYDLEGRRIAGDAAKEAAKSSGLWGGLFGLGGSLLDLYGKSKGGKNNGGNDSGGGDSGWDGLDWAKWLGGLGTGGWNFPWPGSGSSGGSEGDFWNDLYGGYNSGWGGYDPYGSGGWWSGYFGQ